MQIVLHAGFHKTGTTAFQSFMKDNRPGLAEAGLVYPDMAPLGAKNEAGHFYFAHGLATGTLEPETIRRFLEEKADEGVCLFLSVESVIRHALPAGPKDTVWSAKKRYLERLRQALPEECREILFTLREPFSLIQSYYNESVKKTDQSGSLGDYARGAFACP